MQGNILFGGIKQLCHLQLRQPNGLLLRPQLDLAAAIFGGIENEIAHASNPSCDCHNDEHWSDCALLEMP